MTVPSFWGDLRDRISSRDKARDEARLRRAVVPAAGSGEEAQRSRRPKDGPADRFAVVVPVYNHGRTARGVARAAAALGWPVWVVDDGSTDGGSDGLEAEPGVQVLRHPVNRGKGAALLSGFRAAAGHADWAITLDADGQHDPLDVPGLIAAIPAGQRPIVVGRRRRMAAEGAPWTSRFGRGFSNFWIRMAAGPRVSDSQSGLRIYPLPEVLALDVRARRYEFEVEVLVRAAWAGVPVVEAPVSVRYFGAERVSHFRPFVDFCRDAGTFGRLITHRVLRGVPSRSPGRERGRPGGDRQMPAA